MSKAERDALKCKCGVAVSLYFSERLGRYTCPVCQEAEIIALIASARHAHADRVESQIQRGGKVDEQGRITTER